MPQTKVVDTRKATAVNLDKYDEKLQDMAEGRTGGGRQAQQQTQGKEKFRNSKQAPGQRLFSNKRKQEEAGSSAPPAAGDHQEDPRHRADPR